MINTYFSDTEATEACIRLLRVMWCVLWVYTWTVRVSEADKVRMTSQYNSGEKTRVEELLRLVSFTSKRQLFQVIQILSY